MSKSKTKTIKEYYLKNGERRFMFKVYLGVNPLTGRENYTTRRGFKKEKEAKLELSRIKLAVNEGTYRKEKAETFKEVYELWIKQYEKSVEESTFIKTTGIFRNHILPAMGNYKIAKINVDVCQRLVNDWEDKLKKFRIVKSYASKVLDFAIKRDYIQRNPFKLVEIPNRIKKMQMDEDLLENFYTKEQLKNFLECIKRESNFKAYVFFLLLANSGMRKGEALALNWSDINFNKNEIRINKALSRGKDSKLYIKSTKTGLARTIKMDSFTMGILKEWKKKQRQDYLILGYKTKHPKQLVFSNKSNNFLQPTQPGKWLQHVLIKYKLPKITVHGFRHTHCSLILEATSSIKSAQLRLGHSDPKITLQIYAHVSQQTKDRVVDKLEEYMAI